MLALVTAKETIANVYRASILISQLDNGGPPKDKANRSKVTAINKSMHYLDHYNRLIERARNRTLESYTEKHHIIPRCLGGNNKKENIVSLSAREHYVAHQLLVKMNPTHHGLIKAANMMGCCNSRNRRSGNRLYEWLRTKHSKVMSESQSGSGNSQYGTIWIYNESLNQAKKITKSELIPVGWRRGKTAKKKCFCAICNCRLSSANARFCNAHRPAKNGSRRASDARFDSRKDEFIKFIKSGYSFDASLKLVGYKNYNMKHGVGKKAQALLDHLNIQRPLSPRRPPKALA